MESFILLIGIDVYFHDVYVHDFFFFFESVFLSYILSSFLLSSTYKYSGIGLSFMFNNHNFHNVILFFAVCFSIPLYLKYIGISVYINLNQRKASVHPTLSACFSIPLYLKYYGMSLFLYYNQ